MKRSDINDLLAMDCVQELLTSAGMTTEGFRSKLEEEIPEDTPNAHWMVNGEPDPFDGRYNCERKELSMGDLSDYDFANKLYLHGEDQPTINELLAGTKKRPIVWLTAGKDRIRWLSFQNHLKDLELKRLKGE